ncbi:MAG TPA: hypothetical protein VKX39_12315 [Bryobacteraceae bacterium]|nr:hypothetical protein [Bryobacteraceae bacterium]
MLAYAGKGLPSDQGGGGQLRHLLARAAEALAGLADAYAVEIKEQGLQPWAPYQAYLAMLRRDSEDARVAIEMVSSLPSISSQVIDNLNALVHLRSLLTDLFLIDEILRPQRVSAVQE